MVDPAVSEAVRGGGVAELDERGLMPLAEARAVVRAVTAFVKGEGELVDGKLVLASDQIWAALLSLEDGAELVAAALRLDWQFQPRGMDNVDLFRRYGDAIVPWLASRVDAAGVLHDHPWCVQPCLLACGDDAAFDVVWRVRQSRPPLAPRWIDRHPETAARQLTARAAAGDTRAAAHLAARDARAGRPPGVTAAAILALLDAAAARMLGAATLWPALPGGDGPALGHGLRAIAARHGDAWGLAVERLEGDRPAGMYAARVAVFAYGPRVPGRFAGVAASSRPLAVSGGPATPSDFVPWLRARDGWGPPSLALPALGLPPDAAIVAVIPDLAHVAPLTVDPVGPFADDDPHRLPSASAVYRALAAALSA